MELSNTGKEVGAYLLLAIELAGIKYICLGPITVCILHWDF